MWTSMPSAEAATGRRRGTRRDTRESRLMNVLGIHDGHNSSAALLVDGVVRAAVQEERLSGVKNETRVPHLAIAEVMRLAGVTWKDVDVVAAHSQHMPQARSR